MNTYEIDQLIVLVEKHRVQAESPAEAIVKVFGRESVLVDINIMDFCHERGLPAEDYPTIAEELRKAGIMTGEAVIPSISNIEEVRGPRFTIPEGAEVEIRFNRPD